MPERGLEPPRVAPRDFESRASTIPPLRLTCYTIPYMKKRSILILLAVILIAGVVAFFTVNRKTHHFIDKSITSSDMAIKVFLEMMIPHHQEAVRTSEQVLADKDIENFDLKILSGRMVDAQTFEVIQMISWYEDWFKMEYDLTGVSHAKQYMPMMNTASTTGKALERAYVKGMIKHHKMAVEMAQELIDAFDAYDGSKTMGDGDLVIHESHPNIDTMRAFAQKIIDVQSKEIEQLSSLKFDK